MAIEDTTADIRERMDQLKTVEDLRRLSDDRAATVRLAQRAVNRRRRWNALKKLTAQAKLAAELAQLDLEEHAGARLDEEDIVKRNKARQQLIPGISPDGEDDDDE